MTDETNKVTDQEALLFHASGRPGKIEITPTKPVSYTHLTLPTIYSV